jgi:predicted lipoprotein with Yx(FWY)xxD motif
MELMRHQASKRSAIGRIGTTVCAIGAVTASVLAFGLTGVAGAQAAANGTISTTQNQKLGTILVAGKPVYTLKASSTSCGTQCLKIWPEVVLPKGMTKAKAGNGVTASKLGTVKRTGGALQVTYGGKPLYYFVGDGSKGKRQYQRQVGQVVDGRDQARSVILRFWEHRHDVGRLQRRLRRCLVLVAPSKTEARTVRRW